MPHSKERLKRITQSLESHSLIALTGILLVALGIRLWLAPHPGHSFDVPTTESWVESAVKLGVAQSYREQVRDAMLPDHPPLSLLLYAGTGKLYRTFVSPPYDIIQPHHRVFTKLPSIGADVLICVLLFLFLRDWKGKLVGMTGAFIYAVHPVSLLDGAIWGQTDAVFTGFLFAAFYALTKERPILLGITAALAILAKAQALMFAPFFLVLLPRNWRFIVNAFLAGAVTAVIITAPFIVGNSVEQMLNAYVYAMKEQTRLSFNAYNAWWALFGDLAWDKSDAEMLFGLVRYRTAGLTMFLSFYALLLGACRRRLRHRRAEVAIPMRLAVLACISMAFFTLNTQMHERYMFPFIVFALPLAFLRLRYAILYALTSILILANIAAAMPYGALNRAVHQAFPTLDVLIASAIVSVFVWFAADVVIVRAHGKSEVLRA